MTRSDGSGGARVVCVVVGGGGGVRDVGGCVQVNREEKALVVVMMIVHSSLVPQLFHSIGTHRTADIIYIDKGPYTYEISLILAFFEPLLPFPPKCPKCAKFPKCPMSPLFLYSFIPLLQNFYS